MGKRLRRFGARWVAWVVGALLVGGVSGGALAAPVLGQTNDFEDGTTQGWVTGASNPFQVTNATGGPAGAADKFIQLQAAGVGGAGSKLVLFNMASQWTGSYPAAVKAIEMDLKNLGADALTMRITLRGTSGDQFSSASGFSLAADGQWHHARFELSESALSPVFAIGTVADLLSGGVAEVRLLHASSPAYVGDTFTGTVGVDNVKAAGVVPEPATWGLAGLGAAGLLAGRRARRAR